jgi:hypothetical protein
MLAHCLNQREVHQSLTLPEGRVEMRSRVAGTVDGGWRVEQSWGGIQLQFRQARLLGREVALCTGTFNDYVIVPLADRAELEAFGLPQVLALWQEAAKYSGFQDVLRSRLVALAPNRTMPHARFYTCGRLHPGAPLTGLATLAVGTRHINWLASLLKDRRLEHRRGTDVLPVVQETPGRMAISFPAIHVVLRGA